MHSRNQQSVLLLDQLVDGSLLRCTVCAASDRSKRDRPLRSRPAGIGTDMCMKIVAAQDHDCCCHAK